MYITADVRLGHKSVAFLFVVSSGWLLHEQVNPSQLLHYHISAKVASVYFWLYQRINFLAATTDKLLGLCKDLAEQNLQKSFTISK